MYTDLKHRILEYVTKNQFALLMISVIFFFVWGGLVFDYGDRFTKIFPFSDKVLLFGGIVFPFILLIMAIQYKSSFAFGITMAIFLFAIQTNIYFLPYHIQAYQSEIPNCFGCPMYEIESNVKTVLVSCIAIYLMNRESFRVSFKWSKNQSIGIISIVSILYLAAALI